ncbi:putative UDP-rhamnose:rhamnosyltransferase 1 [Iris pallida]|uniref:UDP-rhamnose:rhamnosyltransferase 1 n=1 Tax=Iris pallida TaxID=29817 RepID=A0AAX6G607_IRIPA|nr:putative UDP-rhamnose:rhamnosyltransferase 1 [Iris pallida]KAJ6823758.1 putative UDP-rhamnose:rhamnosyltransferase 1 [Iris pallida]
MCLAVGGSLGGCRRKEPDGDDRVRVDTFEERKPLGLQLSAGAHYDDLARLHGHLHVLDLGGTARVAILGRQLRADGHYLITAVRYLGRERDLHGQDSVVV